MEDQKPPDLSVLLKAMQAVMEDVGYIQKDGRVAFGKTKYNFVSAAGLISKIRPAMLKHGLLLIPSDGGAPPQQEIAISNKDGKETINHYVLIEMTYTLSHVSGVVWPHKIKIPASGYDSGDKATYKAMTGAIKYALLSVFLLETGDDPEEEKFTASDISDIEKLLEEAHSKGQLEPEYKKHFRDWKRIATPDQLKKIEAKKDKLKAKKPTPKPEVESDLPENMIRELVIAYDVDGWDGLKTQAEKMIGIDPDFELDINTEVDRISATRQGA